MSRALTVCPYLTRFALGCALVAGAVPVARAQDGPEAAPPAQAEDAPAAAPAMTEGQKLRFREPVPGPWPLIEIERYDSELLGPDPGGRGIEKMLDIDLLFLFGYRNEERSAAEAQPPGDYGYSYLMPLYWSNWSPRAADTWVGPLYGYMRRGDQWRMFVPPLLAGGAGGPDGWDATVLFPFGWAGARGDNWWAHLAPVWWSGGGPDHTYAGLLPAFWYDRRGEDVTLVTPAGGYGKRKDFTYAAVTPLFHHWRDTANRSGGDLALPLYYHWFSPDESGHLLLPLGGTVWDREQGSTTVFGPVFHTESADGGEATGGVLPLVWWYRHDASKTRSFTAFPLVFHYQTGDTDRRTVVFPFYWDFDTGQQRHQHLWPFYGYDAWRSRDGQVSYESWSSVFPFFRVWKDRAAGTTGWDLPWPIAGGAWGRDHAHAHVAPLLWYERKGDDWSLISAALAFGQGDAKGEWGVWLPVAGYWKNHENHHTMAMGPLSHYWSDGDWANWSVAFPVFYGSNDTAGRWQFRFLWEGLAVEGEGDSSFEWRVLGKFMQYRRLGEEMSFEVNPLVRYHSKGEQYRYFDILLGLYSYEREGATTHHGFLWYW